MAATAKTPIPIRTTVLRRRVITCGSSSTIVADASAGSVQWQKSLVGPTPHHRGHTGQRGRASAPPGHSPRSTTVPPDSPDLPSWIGSGGVPGPDLTRRFGFFTTVRHRCRRSSSPPSDTMLHLGICRTFEAGPFALVVLHRASIARSTHGFAHSGTDWAYVAPVAAVAAGIYAALSYYHQRRSSAVATDRHLSSIRP